MPSPIPDLAAGPVLFARGGDASRTRLSALVVTRDRAGAESGAGSALRPMGGEPAPSEVIARLAGYVFRRYDFELPVARDAHYRFGDERHPVLTESSGTRRLAYVSCNGQEHEDRTRPIEERDRMWRRLAAEHAREPFALLLHGGDQLYADEASDAHPTLTAWADSPNEERGAFDFDTAAREAARRYFVERYVELYTREDVALLLARVPSVMMWDDHDIFDGWGSHPPALLDSPVGRGLFDVARETFLLFQRALPVDTGTPGESLSFALEFPDFLLLVPDLRSERRPERVMGEGGWSWLEEVLARARGVERVLLMSSVPLLGPRLSHIEALIGFVPPLARYEDDLRDQWQSRAHRVEWRRLLEALDTLARAGSEVTALSGEIHLASRGEMPLGTTGTLHQLIASGISHPPPPRVWARALGWLAALGEDPVPGRRVRLHPIPGRRGIYAAERNYLVLERKVGRWSAEWECEESGRTPSLSLGGTP